MPLKKVYKRKTVKKSYKKRPTVAKSVKAYVAKAIKKAPEIQNKDSYVPKGELFHNSFYNPFDMFQSAVLPSIGDGDTAYSGQKYRLLGYRIRLLCGQKADRPNVTWRVSFFSMKENVSKTYGNCFTNTTGVVLLDDLNDKYTRKIKEFWFKPYKGSIENGTDEFTFTKQFYIPYKRIINTNGSSGVPTNHDPVYMTIHVYDAYGTLTTDNIGYVTIWTSCKFQDI